MNEREFITRVRIESSVLRVWLEEGWIMPEQQGDLYRFGEADVARAFLIHDLRDDFGVNREGIGVILHLVDQIHSLRFAMRRLMEANAEEKARKEPAEKKPKESKKENGEVEDPVTEASEESFPASDPPSWGGFRAGKPAS